MSSPDLTELAWDLASDGFVGHEAAVRQVAGVARAAGVSDRLVGILADTRQPEIARLRAFGLVAAQVAVASARPAEPVPHAA